jgi:FkbM family methyltransferase
MRLRPWLWLRAVLVATVVSAGAIAGVPFLRHLEANRRCCQIPLTRNVVVTWKEMRGDAVYPSEIGQDKWVLETMFPWLSDGYFVDVGSGHGTIGSNSKALEARGWTGLCIDPFPVYMEGRTCAVLREVVFSEAGRTMAFHEAGGLGGLAETLAAWNERGAQAPTVDFTTVTLDDVLTRANAPALIHFMSLDIEGAELEALRGFPFERVRLGALVVEHNREEPKRTQLRALLETHGYARVHSWQQDDFYAPIAMAAPRATVVERSVSP